MTTLSTSGFSSVKDVDGSARTFLSTPDTTNEPTLVIGFGDSYIDASDLRPFPEGLAPVQARFNSQGLIAGYNRWADHGLLGVDAAQGGATSQDLVDKMLDKVKAAAPTIVVLRVGTNDIFQGIPVDTFKRNVQFMVAQLAPANVIVTPQTAFKGCDAATLASFNAAIDEVIANNDNAHPCPINHFDPATMLDLDEVHPDSFGGIMYGKDIHHAVSQVLTSTWTPEVNLLPAFEDYAAIDPATSAGAMGMLPAGWSAHGKAHHSPDSQTGWHKMVYGGDHQGLESIALRSAKISNHSALPIKVQATCQFKLSGMGGKNTEDWMNSDSVVLSLQNAESWQDSTSDTIANWGEKTGGVVPEGQLKTGYLTVQPGKSVIVELQMNGGNRSTSTPELVIGNVTLAVVEGELSSLPTEPEKNLIENGQFEQTLAPWIIDVPPENNATVMGDGFAQCTITTSWWGGIYQSFNVEQAGLYILRVETKAMTAGKMMVIRLRQTEGDDDALWASVNTEGKHEFIANLQPGEHRVFLTNGETPAGDMNVYQVGHVQLFKAE